MPAQFSRNVKGCSGYVLMATCEVCGATANYGLRGTFGEPSKWWCREHLPNDFLPAAE